MDKVKEDYNFKTDIIVGEQGESIIREDLETMGLKFIKDNKDNKYDIIMSSGSVTSSYEIKTDVFCKEKNDTGNMFIEYDCRNKASGISVTEADWFVMYYPYLKKAYYIKIGELRNLIKYNNFRKATGSGDIGSNTKGYLINRSAYERFFIIRNIDKNFVVH